MKHGVLEFPDCRVYAKWACQNDEQRQGPFQIEVGRCSVSSECQSGCLPFVGFHRCCVGDYKAGEVFFKVQGLRCDGVTYQVPQVSRWRVAETQRGGAFLMLHEIDVINSRSSVLRHRVVELKLNVRSDGYVPVKDLLKLNTKTNAGAPLHSYSVDDIGEAVKRDKISNALVYWKKRVCSILEQTKDIV